MPLRGVIIEESLENPDVLKEVKILRTKVEPATEKHKTPWLKQWTLHTADIPEGRAWEIAEKISLAIDHKHKGSWYADFKNDATHYITFREKVFRIDRSRKEEYDEAVEYGLSLGIPAHQLDFSPDIAEWQR